jgi:maltose O-acetyltransferase
MQMSDDPEYLKMIRGEDHDGSKPVFFALQAEAALRKAALDAAPAADFEALAPLMADYFGGEAAMNYIVRPFTCEYGKHVRFGRYNFINTGATFLDSAFITFGDSCMVGPNVQFITADHPVAASERFQPAEPGGFLPYRVVNRARPIRIGSKVWIGAGAIILPDVTIGDEAVIGAGSVVTRDVPAQTLVAGNPARVIRRTEPDAG